MSTKSPALFYTQVQTDWINKALQVLGKDDLTLIIHGGSFPKSIQTDTGFGSPYGQDAQSFYLFVKSLGFNGIQLGPAGKTKSVDRSPYTGTLFSSNPLFIDFFKLQEISGFQLLIDPAELTQLVAENPTCGEDRISYEYLYPLQQLILDKMYTRFETLKNAGQEAVVKINADFEHYKKENADWLFQDALYEALTSIHGTDYWPHWKSEIDRLLLSETVSKADRQKRIEEITQSAAHVMGSYQFTQYLLSLLKKQAKQYCKTLGLKLIADHQVAFSDRDTWANQAYFLQNYCLGAPPDYFSKSGQAWGFPVLHPHRCFNEEGQLLAGAQFLKRLFTKVFNDNPGGVRIDHIIGLIDPWVYAKGTSPKPEDGAARLYSSPEHPDLCHYTYAWHEDINWQVPRDDEAWVKSLSLGKIEKYARFIDLILKAADEAGAPHSGIICEDLGTLTYPVKKVLASRQLSGIRITQFVDPDVPDHIYRGRSVEEKHWIMTGSHDNQPLTVWVKNLFKDKTLLAKHVRYLVEDFSTPEMSNTEKELLFNQLMLDKKMFLKYKLAELFISPSRHVQLFFADLFGIEKYYNRPGLSGRDSWTLRLPSQYQALYSENLESTQLACSLPEVLKLALQTQLVKNPSKNGTEATLMLSHLETLF